MEKRKITITIDKAVKWYKSENATLKELALQAFNKDELTHNFKDITTFKDACETLGLSYKDMDYTAEVIAIYSKASAAMFQINIVRKALNLGCDLSLTENPKNSFVYYPCNPFVAKNSTSYKDALKLGEMEKIGVIESERISYTVLGGSADFGYNTGLGSFISRYGEGKTFGSVGFLGCASEEIARHFSKYFGMLITEAKYADMVDFEIIEDKYNNTK